ncbi:MAG: arylsulfotransferase family protein, partial [Planctomycetales bacterium]
YSKVGGYGNHDTKVLVPTKAKTTGSHASSLMKTLKAGHHNVQLPQDEWRALAAWIDCNAPYYGDHKEIITVKDLAAITQPPSKSINTLQRSFAVADLRRNEALIIRNGKILWSYPVKSATEMKTYPDGAYLISGQKEVVMVDRAKHTRFKFTGNGLFSTERLPNGNFLVNDNSSNSLIELNSSGQEITRTSTTIKNSKVNKHHHALHIQHLPNGDRWVAHRDNNFARKYSSTGKILRTINMPCSVTSVQELPNGHVLIAGGKPARLSEFDQNGKEIWALTANDVPDANLMTICGFQRLPNGNTILTNWTGHGFKGKYLPIIEVNQDKKLVWSFSDTTLIPEPVSIQIL